MGNGTKSIFRSKTFYFFLLYGVVSVAGLLGFADYTPSGDESEIVGIVVSVAGVVLRFVTNKGVTLG